MIGMELFKALTVAEARMEITRLVNLRRRVKTVELTASLGLASYSGITSPSGVPGFDRSSVDGFAALARDTFGASDGLPAYLDVAGEVLMGCPAPGPARGGQAFRIPTGGMLPDGCDAVVMVEHTEELDGTTIGILRPAAPGENVVRRGEDMAHGAVIVPGGRVLRPQDLGVLAAAGICRVEVAEPLKVAVISTGNELVGPEQEPGPGQVRDINSYLLYGLVREAGASPVLCGITGDSGGDLATELKKRLEEADLVLISGGSSVGAMDVTCQAIESIESPGVLFHGLSIKPGKPTIGAVVGGKPVFGLPGHPVSAAVVFLMMVEPLLTAGRYPATPVELMMEFPVAAKITRNLRSAAGREDFVRVSLRAGDGGLLADPVLGKSGLIATMSRSDGLARIPEAVEGVEAGQVVFVKLL